MKEPAESFTKGALVKLRSRDLFGDEHDHGVVLTAPRTTSAYRSDFLDALRREPPTTFDSGVSGSFKTTTDIMEERVAMMVQVHWTSTSIQRWHFLEDLEVLSPT
tara:strand:+ start:266 stop:580 length:315 start_codon:yes stop_codon:yes gene_type:complete